MIAIMKKISFKGFGRRQVTLVSLVILIAIAGYINITHKNSEVIPVSGVIDEPREPSGFAVKNEDDYFSLSRHERDKSRSAAMEVYREITSGAQSSTEAKENAQKDLAACAKAIEAEAFIEGLIRAKGFEQALVYINSGNANVVVKTIGLTPAQAAQIKDLIVENAKISADKIKIVEIK